MPQAPRKKSNVIGLNERRSETNSQVLERLFRDHGRALRTFLIGRVQAKEDLDDIIHEVFARLAKISNLAQKLAANRKDNRAFLFTSVNNYIIDQERRKVLERRYQREQQQQEGYLVVELSPEKIASSSEELELIKSAIGRLPSTWRQAFILSRFDHLSYQQIADRMGISVKTVEKYITRALVQLRKVTAKAHKTTGSV
ncbi:MAG: RNA polymerase sigma factor [Porticoccaceae bacterium]|nr:RNA polymerase sigma factor [Porticoccaceae bacterium]